MERREALKGLLVGALAFGALANIAADTVEHNNAVAVSGQVVTAENNLVNFHSMQLVMLRALLDIYEQETGIPINTLFEVFEFAAQKVAGGFDVKDPEFWNKMIDDYLKSTKPQADIANKLTLNF